MARKFGKIGRTTLATELERVTPKRQPRTRPSRRKTRRDDSRKPRTQRGRRSY